MNHEKFNQRVQYAKLAMFIAGLSIVFGIIAAVAGIAFALALFTGLTIIVGIVAGFGMFLMFCDVSRDFKNNLERVESTDEFESSYARAHLSELQKDHPIFYNICEWLARE